MKLLAKSFVIHHSPRYLFKGYIKLCMACRAWWRHQMETFSGLLAICAGNSPVPGEFSAQRPVTQSFDVFFDLRLKKRLSKQSWGWWFEALSRPLWRHRNGIWYFGHECIHSPMICTSGAVTSENNERIASWVISQKSLLKISHRLLDLLHAILWHENRNTKKTIFDHPFRHRRQGGPFLTQYCDTITKWRRMICDIIRTTSKAIVTSYSPIVFARATLKCHHNGRDGVSNHQPHYCLLSRLFGPRSKKTSKLPDVTGLCAGKSPATGELPHKWPVIQKMFPFDDVIMNLHKVYMK